MISRHPTTGAPIRIIRSHATVSKNKNTGVWIEPTFAPSHRWSRWSTILSDPAAIPVLQGIPPSILIIRTAEEVNIWRSVITADTVLFLTESANTALGDCSSMCLGIAELNDLYPFLKESVNEKSPLENIVAAICQLLRFHQLVSARSVSETTITVPFDTTDTVVPHTYWISQYFEPSHPSRAREIRECLEKNIQCPYIDHILLLTEKECSLPTSDKLIVHPFGKRATYADTFQVAIDKIPSGQQSILIFSNSDIWFDASLRSLWSINLQDRLCLALLRWEGSAIFGPRPDSQDTWILGRDALTLDLTPFRFQYGIPGCDNVVSVELLKQKFLIVNPAYTIKTYHHHASSIRSYHARDDILFSPVYLYIDPSAIESFGITSSFGTPVSSIGSSIKTFSREALPIRTAAEAVTPYTPPAAAAVYHIERPDGIFVTPDNLLYDFNTIWVNDVCKQRWASSTLHTLAPTIAYDSLIAILGADMTNPAAWMVQIVPHILRIQAHDPAARYIIPPGLQSLFPDGIPYQSGVQSWSKSVWAIPSLPAPPTQEDIELLRSHFVLEAVAPAAVPTIVFLLSEDLLTLHHAEQMYNIHCVHAETRWNVHYVHASDSVSTIRTALTAANWIITEESNPLRWWCWMAAPGSTVVEFQHEHARSEELIHLAGAASLHYVLGIQRFREPVEDRRQTALVDLGIALKRHGMASRLQELTSAGKVTLPVITLPVDMTGMHVHSGDSFRDMIQLWKERGYCTVEPSARTPFCWWNGIGNVLLYDRDTFKWMEVESPLHKLALIGNPAPVDRTRHSRWSYWPRYPHLVETVRPRPWNDRPIRSLFLGRIENGVQQKHRSGADWKSAIELFECPIDSSGGSYKYTPAEYLQKLCNAKFGLCLAGYGAKCHREIEYYACGTVPIATPDCDMTGYLDPPVEGVHFLRASTPADVIRIVETTSRSTWERLSIAGRLWWKVNASAEGLFRLTANRIHACLPTAGIALPL